MTTYCVLGGGGAFGIHTAQYLLDHGADRVIGIGRNPLRPEPFTLGIEKHKGYTYRAYHVTHELDLLLEYLDAQRPEIIVNFAAQGEGAASWQHSWRFFETNAMALSRLVEALMQRDWLQRFVHIGTSEVYGSADHAMTEDASTHPTSPYAASKLAFDHYLLAVMSQGFPATILRPSNAYCPGQLLHRVVPRAIVAGLSGVKIPLQGGGRARKSYIHARDLARAIHMVSMHGEGYAPIYNVGPAEPMSIRALVGACATALNLGFGELTYSSPARPGEDACYWLDSSRIYADLGWEPMIPLDEGLAEMVEWGRRYLDVLRDWPTDYQLRA